MKTKPWAICLSALLLLTALTGCQSAQTGANKEITICNTFEIKDFHTVQTPETGTDNSFMYFTTNFYNTLIGYENGKYVPELAEEWNVSDDGLTYTFTLKKGIKFSDGEPLNAEAVKKCFESIPIQLGQFNGSYGRTSLLFKEIIAVDEQTVEIRLTMPYYGALKDFTMVVPMGISSPNTYNEDGTVKADTKTRTFGTGPYVYAGDFDGTTFTFVTNPNYWGEKPEVDSFKLKVIPDNDAKVLALRNGELDAIIGVDKISFDAYTEMQSTDGFGALSSEAIDVTRLIVFNNAKAPFDELAVRQAVNYAIDKKAICDGLFDGLEMPADSIFDKSLQFCNVETQTYAFDVEKAKSLLEDAGWMDSDGDGIREKDGVKLSVEGLYMANAAMYNDLAQTITFQLKAIGMEAKILGMDMMAYYAQIMEGKWGFSLAATYGAIFENTFVSNMDPRMPMDPVANQLLVPTGKADSIMDTLNAQFKDDDVAAAYKTLLEGIADGASCVPLSYTNELMIYNSDKVAGYAFLSYPTQVHIKNIDLK